MVSIIIVAYRAWRNVALSPCVSIQDRQSKPSGARYAKLKSFFVWFVMNIGMALTLVVASRPTVAFAEMILREVDGGPEYYNKFSSPLPSDPNFFPLGVWFESVVDGNADRDKDAGLNLYIVLTRDSNLSLVQRNGMRAILQSDWRTNQTAINSPAVAGWMAADEIDMQQGPDQGATTLKNRLSQLPKDGRMRYNNYGKGVMFWETDAQAGRFVNDFQDVGSADIYWFTDPNVARSSEGGKLLNRGSPLTVTQTRRAANYGYTVDRMRALNVKDGPRKPIWNFVEVCWPFSESAAKNGRAILPDEVKGAVWHSIIAGARGVIYFNHSFGGPNPSQHCLRDPAYAAVRASVKSTNELVTQLAPVLNAPFADGFVSASPSTRTMAKFYDSRYYVFSGSKENEASTSTFSLSEVDSGTATVVGENRTIRITNGQFSDRFADGNAIHIYRIDSK
jgi:hypothetical protein